MSNISFTSTYRIPITQAGATPGKKDKLRDLVEPYPNKLVSKSNTGTVRVSMSDKEDAKFIRNLKAIGYKVFQKFEGENIKKGNLDTYIKNKLALGEYEQFGAQKKRLSTSAKSKRHGALAERERIQTAKENETKTSVQTELTETTAQLHEAYENLNVMEQRLAEASQKAEDAQKAKLLAEIIEETKKSRSVVESAAKRRTILRQAAKRTEEARKLAEIAELEKAECTMQYNEALERVEDAKLLAEVKEEVLRGRMSAKTPKASDDFDPYDTDFDFEAYEI